MLNSYALNSALSSKQATLNFNTPFNVDISNNVTLKIANPNKIDVSGNLAFKYDPSVFWIDTSGNLALVWNYALSQTLNNYTTSTFVQNNYLSLSGASNTYLTIATAASTYANAAMLNQKQNNLIVGYPINISGSVLTFNYDSTIFKLDTSNNLTLINTYDTIALRNTALSSYLPLSGGTTTGTLTIGSGLQIRINGTTTSTSTNCFSMGGYGTFNIDAPNIIGGRFVIQYAGNVGIGISTPTHLLDFNGTFNISVAATLGSSLTVTGSTSCNSGLGVSGTCSIVHSGSPGTTSATDNTLFICSNRSTTSNITSAIKSAVVLLQIVVVLLF